MIRKLLLVLGAITCLANCPSIVFAAPPTDYTPSDPGLRLELIDSSPNESFLSIRCDGLGRLFVGGREAVFRYDPDDKGGYKPRVELFRFPPHSWAYDLELRGPDLYVLTMNALYVLPDGAIKTEGLKPKRLLWGVPAGHVHQCFHGLAWGPEGDLYISMGDPLWYYGDFDRPDHWGHWSFFTPDAKRLAEMKRDGWHALTNGKGVSESAKNNDAKDNKVAPLDHALSDGQGVPPGWQRHPYNGVGAVFRIRPDGTGFQTVATGLRNSCGLVFDSNFNLFTNDNDHEGLPHAYVPGRLNHVVPHAYFSWPRGWMPHITPERADLLDTMTTGLGRAVPVGQSYYDDAFLGEQYRNNLLVARWCTRAVTRYPLTPAGATFHCEEKPLIVGKDLARPVGVTVGRGGRIFVTVSFMANNEGSPIYRSDLAMLTKKDDPPTHPFEAFDALKATNHQLLREFSNDSWSRRYLAFVELTRRGPKACNETFGLLPYGVLDRSACLTWIVAAAGRDLRNDSDQANAIKERLQYEGPFQAIRALTEFFGDDPSVRKVFEAGLKAENAARSPFAETPRSHVQLAALTAVFKQPGPLPQEVVNDFARSDDRYLRHIATQLMAERLNASELNPLANSDDVKTRMAAVLASGFRLTLPKVDEVLDESMPLAPWRNPDEAYLIQYADEKEKTDLRKFGRVGTYTVAEHWKAQKKHTDDQEQLFALLAARLDDQEESVRLQAAHFLSVLNDPRSEPKVQSVRRKNEQGKLQLADLINPDKAWVAGPFPDSGKGFETVHAPERGPIDLSAQHSVGERSVVWKQMTRGPRFFNFHEAFGDVSDSSSYAFFRLESPRKQQAMLLVGSDDGIKVWHNGRVVHTNDISRAALPLQDIVYLDLEPGGNDILFRVRNLTGESGLYIHYRTLDKIPVTLPEPVSAGSLTERLKNATTTGNAPVDPKFLSVNWLEEAKTGDIARGKKLFSAEGLGCAKCHAIRADQPVTGGPSLAETAKRFTIPHLVESVLAPSRMVSPVFKATLVITKDGRQSSGLVIGETGEKLELLLPDAKRVTFAKPDIEETKLQDISPMPAGLVKQPEELRDLLAFLLSEQPH